ncbi:hypothetical protein Csa_002719 [Cucumis sativus]|uniref:Uncharacterized protein n=1 Tax=Cucumis sativus TaxID=3659 RepID=A0A0A0KGH3_CUCSA|nr:hypothetical protein Csa_002719 [Cucumis sativus]
MGLFFFFSSSSQKPHFPFQFPLPNSGGCRERDKENILRLAFCVCVAVVAVKHEAQLISLMGSPLSLPLPLLFAVFLSFLSLWPVGDFPNRFSFFSSHLFVSGVELSNPSGETEEKLEEDSGLGILSRETLQIGEDFWCLTHWKGKKKVLASGGVSSFANYIRFKSVFIVMSHPFDPLSPGSLGSVTP